MQAHRGGRFRAPWPYHMIIDQISTSTIGRVCVMLGNIDKDSPLVIVDPPAVKGQQTQISGSAQDPEVEQTFEWDDFVYGMGQQIQSSTFSQLVHIDKRYFFALGVDASIGGQLMPGPAVTSGTPGTRDSTNGISQFYELGGNLYAVNGRYILYWDGSNFSVSHDQGSGKKALHAQVVKQNSSGSTAYAFIAMGDSDNFWYHDGVSTTANWTQHASLKALCWEIKGNEIFRGVDVSRIEKCDLRVSPLTAGNWTTNDFRVGDYQYPIQRMRCNAAGTLVIFKQDSIHALDATGNDVLLYPVVKLTPSATNGLVAEVWENDLFTVYNDCLYKIGPNLEFLPIGPERLTENTSVVKGPITACVGGQFRMYAGLKNIDTGNSYLMGLGAWPRSDDGSPSRLDVWHGSLTAAFSTKSVTGMFITSAGSYGAPSGHRLCWLGFSDGTWSSFILPCVPNPKGCTSTTFNTTNSFTPSYFHGGYPASSKLIRGFTVTGLNPHQLKIPSITDNDFGGAGSIGLQDFTAVPAKRQDIHWGASTPTRVLLSQSWTDITGVVTGVGVHYQVKETPQRVYQFAVLVADGLTKQDGSPMRMGQKALRTFARQIQEELGTVYITFPDETTEYCTVKGYKETVALNPLIKRGNSWTSAVLFTVVTTEPTLSFDTGSGPYSL